MLVLLCIDRCDNRLFFEKFIINQTNGQIMNIYRGWFSQNGCCGYVLKPTYLRGKYSTFNLRRKDAIISGIFSEDFDIYFDHFFSFFQV